MGRRANSNWPLKTILGRVLVERVELLELECGHLAHPPTNRFGYERYGQRMRCWKCGKGRPADDPATFFKN